MRKSVIGSDGSDQAVPADGLMDLERVARVEVSSEEPGHPVEAALVPGRGQGLAVVIGVENRLFRRVDDAR